MHLHSSRPLVTQRALAGRQEQEGEWVGVRGRGWGRRTGRGCGGVRVYRVTRRQRRASCADSAGPASAPTAYRFLAATAARTCCQVRRPPPPRVVGRGAAPRPGSGSPPGSAGSGALLVSGEGFSAAQDLAAAAAPVATAAAAVRRAAAGAVPQSAAQSWCHSARARVPRHALACSGKARTCAAPSASHPLRSMIRSDPRHHGPLGPSVADHSAHAKNQHAAHRPVCRGWPVPRGLLVCPVVPGLLVRDPVADTVTLFLSVDRYRNPVPIEFTTAFAKINRKRNPVADTVTLFLLNLQQRAKISRKREEQAP